MSWCIYIRIDVNLPDSILSQIGLNIFKKLFLIYVFVPNHYYTRYYINAYFAGHMSASMMYIMQHI